MISIKNIRLPNKPLNNLELEDPVKKLKIRSFRGVFLLDTLPKKPNKKESGIVNFDKSGGPGTHWVTWYKNGKTKIYFGSYGVQPPIEVDRKADTLLTPIKFNRQGKYFVVIYVYTFSKNLARVTNSKKF